MSCDPSIRLAGICKTFHVHDSPAMRVASIFSSRFAGHRFEALSSVDFTAQRGDCVGIVGRNGAGKSTLLQIVSGVMAPTAGSVMATGRIAAMLQLGAGFNGEFTGRQNVRLSAAIHGLGPAEIEARMASIEAFAGIGAKIDRPVREYSSGMFARLAFSVCAHVDPDILIVDEILGVGDAEFQQRSMRFLRNFRRKGIVLFVSHDEHAVSAICNRVLWIEAGRKVDDGPARTVLRRYRRHMAALVAGADHFAGPESGTLLMPEAPRPDPSSLSFDPDDPPAARGGAAIDRVDVHAAHGLEAAFAGGEQIVVSVHASARIDLEAVRVLAFVRNPMGQVVFELDSRRFADPSDTAVVAGDSIACDFRLRLPYLPTGSYAIDAFVMSGGDGAVRVEAVHEGARTLRVVSSHVSAGLANVRMDGVRFEPRHEETPA